MKTMKITYQLEGETQRVGIFPIDPQRSIPEQIKKAVNNSGYEYDKRDKFFIEEVTDLSLQFDKKLVCYGCQDYDDKTYADDFLCKECREIGVKEWTRCDCCDTLKDESDLVRTMTGPNKDFECVECTDCIEKRQKRADYENYCDENPRCEVSPGSFN